MRVAEVVGAGLVVVIVIASITRRSRRKTDSIGCYSRAVTALRTIASEPRHPAHMDEPVVSDSANVHVLPDPSNLRRARHPREPRASHRWVNRVAPELVEQRPVIAHLPTPARPRHRGGSAS